MEEIQREEARVRILCIVLSSVELPTFPSTMAEQTQIYIQGWKDFVGSHAVA